MPVRSPGFSELFFTPSSRGRCIRACRARRHPAPPVEITARIAKRADGETAKTGRGLIAATGVLHFGYGAATGALYPLVADHVRAPPVVTGVAFGLGVWAASYLGWIPAVRLLRPATQQPAERNIVMILAHVAWGAALGLTYETLRRKRRRPAHA